MLPNERWFWGWGAVLGACFLPQVGPAVASFIFAFVIGLSGSFVALIVSFFPKLGAMLSGYGAGFFYGSALVLGGFLAYLWRVYGVSGHLARFAFIAIVFDLGALAMTLESSAFVVCRDTNYVQDHFDSDCPFPGSWRPVLSVPIKMTYAHSKAIAERRAMRRGIHERSP